jgi:hypothetical protein
LESGIGFPTGINKNEIAAHYSPNAGDSVGGYFVLSSPPLSPSLPLLLLLLMQALILIS